MKQKIHQNSVFEESLPNNKTVLLVFGVFLAAGTTLKEFLLSTLNENSHLNSKVYMRISLYRLRILLLCYESFRL